MDRIRTKGECQVNLPPKNLKHMGWGVVGPARHDLLVDGPGGRTLELYGYNDCYYWDENGFKGADEYGIVPIYEDEHGEQFPTDAKEYPYFA